MSHTIIRIAKEMLKKPEFSRDYAEDLEMGHHGIVKWTSDKLYYLSS